MKKNGRKDLPPEDPEEEVLEEFMAGTARARELGQLCFALRTRIKALKADLARRTVTSEREELEKRLKDARHQLAVLEQERAITEFVEDSVRVTLRNETPVVDEYFDEDEA